MFIASTGICQQNMVTWHQIAADKNHDRDFFLSNFQGGNLRFWTFLTNFGPFEKIVDLSLCRMVQLKNIQKSIAELSHLSKFKRGNASLIKISMHNVFSS